jgi:DNA-binding LytR/AlgR family response regulator
MKTLNCWIVDDEPLALDLLESYVKNTPFLNLTGRYSSAKSAMNALQSDTPDLIFLDIQMPLINGLDFAQFIKDKTSIIFTTAFKEYAIDGYKVNAIDYLLKPFSYSSFLNAAKKALAWFETIHAANSVKTNNSDKSSGIFVKADYKIIHVLFDDILYIEGLKNYIKIYTSKQSKPIITLMTMKEIEDELPANDFIRIHRSFIVRKNKIESINKNRIMIAGREFPIGETYKPAFMTLIGNKSDSKS